MNILNNKIYISEKILLFVYSNNIYFFLIYELLLIILSKLLSKA